MSEPPKPFAWAVIGDGYEYATLLAEHAGAVAEEEGGRVVPLYLAPPPVLTDAEREALLVGIEAIRDRLEGFSDCKQLQETLRGLLARLGGGE
jgi:hypothetical protein